MYSKGGVLTSHPAFSIVATAYDKQTGLLSNGTYKIVPLGAAQTIWQHNIATKNKIARKLFISINSFLYEANLHKTQESPNCRVLQLGLFILPSSLIVENVPKIP
jgi:hypothetical protein